MYPSLSSHQKKDANKSDAILILDFIVSRDQKILNSHTKVLLKCQIHDTI